MSRGNCGVYFGFQDINGERIGKELVLKKGRNRSREMRKRRDDSPASVSLNPRQASWLCLAVLVSPVYPVPH